MEPFAPILCTIPRFKHVDVLKENAAILKLHIYYNYLRVLNNALKLGTGWDGLVSSSMPDVCINHFIILYHLSTVSTSRHAPKHLQHSASLVLYVLS